MDLQTKTLGVLAMPAWPNPNLSDPSVIFAFCLRSGTQRGKFYTSCTTQWLKFKAYLANTSTHSAMCALLSQLNFNDITRVFLGSGKAVVSIFGGKITRFQVYLGKLLLCISSSVRVRRRPRFLARSRLIQQLQLENFFLCFFFLSFFAPANKFPIVSAPRKVFPLPVKSYFSVSQLRDGKLSTASQCSGLGIRAVRIKIDQKSPKDSTNCSDLEGKTKHFLFSFIWRLCFS